MAATAVFLSGQFQGQKSLVGSSPWGPKESDHPGKLSTAPACHGAGPCHMLPRPVGVDLDSPFSVYTCLNPLCMMTTDHLATISTR